jgi:hypothetical protein
LASRRALSIDWAFAKLRNTVAVFAGERETPAACAKFVVRYLVGHR